jgi:hypothetical protein
MRFLLAAVLFILAISLLLLGLAQRTIWAPPDQYSISLNTASATPYLVIGAEQLALLPGDPRIGVVGAETVFIATGMESDVLAWVGSTSHYLAANSSDGLGLGLIRVSGTEDFASPLNSDMWKKTVVGQGYAELTISSEQKRAVLIASDGFAPVPQTIRISWPIQTSTVVSDVFMSVGFGLLVLAIILNLLALRKMFINRGPRRKLPRAPQGPKYRPRKTTLEIPKRGRRSARQKIAVPIALGLALTLGGCSATPTIAPTPSESASEELPEAIPPVVEQSQIEKILKELSETVAIADSTSDLELLEQRVAGPSLRFRQTHYLLMSKSDTIEPMEPIPSSVISISLPATTNLWPRSIMVVAESEAGLPQMLVLQQQSPRENYKLWYNIPLLPGSKIPTLPAPEVGAIPVEKDSLFLKLAPSQLPEAFGDVIDRGSESEVFGLFNLVGDEFYEQISSSQRDQIKKLKRAEITFSHALGDDNVISLSTADSGALVAVMMTDNYLIRPTRENAVVTVSGLEEILLGVEGSSRGVRTTYGDMLLFYVPASTSEDKITLLGATQALLSIRAL